MGGKQAKTAVVVAIVVGLAALGGTPADAGGKIAERVLRATADGHQASFVVYLRDQADLSAAYDIQDPDARGRYVYDTLRRQADRTQAPIRRLLASRGSPYRSFWAANVIVAKGDRSLVDALAARADVEVIESNASSRGIEDPAPTSTEVTEWGISSVNAPQLWALGIKGQGIVIGSQDTGVRWTHVALKSHYRGWNGSSATHNYNWWDAIHSSGGNPCGINSQVPCDDQGHGTHTTGTAVGDDGGTNQIGVAPGAKWIACRNMDQGIGTPARYTECFQFMMAPTALSGQNPDPNKRPDVLNNSWACTTSEGCAANTLKTVVDNARAAGIFVVAAAGNTGPACSTVQDPPAIYASSFSVGAVDINNILASFSARGPVTVDGSNRMKPDLVAPGVTVRSATNTSDTSYTTFSGTSMAGPHVAGVVALLWSARPALRRDMARTTQLLTSTANPVGITVANATDCGGSMVVPNNHFGWGRVDALAAYNASKEGAGTLTTPTTGVSASSTGKTIPFTYTAATGGMTDGALTITVPTGWSAPSGNTLAKGYTTASSGLVSISGQTITVSHLTLATGQKLKVTYGSRTGAGPGATAPSTTGNQVWQAKQRAEAAGTLTKLAVSPSIRIYARDGSGTLTTPTSSVAHGSTGKTIVFTYTAASGGMANGTLTIAVPSGWSVPSTVPTAAGYVTASTGTVSVSGQTMTVANVTRSGGQTVTITYGSKASGGPGANAPSSAVGSQTWVSKQRSVAAGILTNLVAGSPVIAIT